MIINKISFNSLLPLLQSNQFDKLSTIIDAITPATPQNKVECLISLQSLFSAAAKELSDALNEGRDEKAESLKKLAPKIQEKANALAMGLKQTADQSILLSLEGIEKKERLPAIKELFKQFKNDKNLPKAAVSSLNSSYTPETVSQHVISEWIRAVKELKDETIEGVSESQLKLFDSLKRARKIATKCSERVNPITDEMGRITTDWLQELVSTYQQLESEGVLLDQKIRLWYFVLFQGHGKDIPRAFMQNLHEMVLYYFIKEADKALDGSLISPDTHKGLVETFAYYKRKDLPFLVQDANMRAIDGLEVRTNSAYTRRFIMASEAEMRSCDLQSAQKIFDGIEGLKNIPLTKQIYENLCQLETKCLQLISYCQNTLTNSNEEASCAMETCTPPSLYENNENHLQATTFIRDIERKIEKEEAIDLESTFSTIDCLMSSDLSEELLLSLEVLQAKLLSLTPSSDETFSSLIEQQTKKPTDFDPPSLLEFMKILHDNLSVYLDPSRSKNAIRFYSGAFLFNHEAKKSCVDSSSKEAEWTAKIEDELNAWILSRNDKICQGYAHILETALNGNQEVSFEKLSMIAESMSPFFSGLNLENKHKIYVGIESYLNAISSFEHVTVVELKKRARAIFEIRQHLNAWLQTISESDLTTLMKN